MPEQFIVGSAGGRIGVAVRKRGGFEFRSVHDDFAPLHGRVFRRARTLVIEIARHAKGLRSRALTEPGSVAGEIELW